MTATQAGQATVAGAYSRTRKTKPPTLEVPVKKAARERAQAVVKKSLEVTSDKVVHSLAQLKLGVTAALDTIGSQLSAEILTLKEVQEAIVAEQGRLKNLYDISAEADTLQTLILAQDEAAREFDLRKTEARVKWDEEQAANDKSRLEYARELQAERKRERETYDYETAKARRFEADKFQADLQTQKTALQVEWTNRERAIDEREETVSALEAEYTRLREAVAKSEEATKAEVSRAVAVATNSLKKELTYDFTVAKLEMDNKLSQLQEKLNTRDTTIAELLKRNAELDAKYTQASDKVQQIAEKAIEGASKQNVVVQTSSDSSESRTRK